jgi:DNA end-binding protein Ku
MTETVEIEAFVDRDAISPMYFEKPNFLVPGKTAEKGYVLLRETLKKTGRVGIGKVVIRTRQYLSALMPQDDALLLNLMRFPQELIQPDQFKLPAGKLSDYRISARELAMAGQLIDSMTASWKPADYRDDFRDQLHKFVERRIAKPAVGQSSLLPSVQWLARISVDVRARPHRRSGDPVNRLIRLESSTCNLH